MITILTTYRSIGLFIKKRLSKIIKYAVYQAHQPASIDSVDPVGGEERVLGKHCPVGIPMGQYTK
ncbi:MAG: hypothetical protein U5K00_21975 [Melioribacteraceae bacterium]|nr:hypothetical protein [Melioribacteraceae bacterium]